MDRFKPGDLLLVKGKTWMGHAIEDISHSPYSHVAGFVHHDDLVEAQGFRDVGYQSPAEYRGQSDIYVCDALTTEKRIEIVRHVTDEIGKHYDYLLIAWEFFRYVFHLMLPYKEPLRSRDCGTLWSKAYKKAGIDLCHGIRFPSPGDLANSPKLKYIGTF